MHLLASIPSPSFNSFSIGPLDLHLYGLLIGTGMVVGVWLAQRKMVERGEDPNHIADLALWCIPAALIGARIYYVLANWGRFADDPGAAFRIWEGGLGIPGGVLLAVLVGYAVARRNEWNLPPIFDAAAFALVVGQIIGRWGNYFNQELYGRPTDLPWGLEIDPGRRVAGFEQFETFHPTFLYEVIWNIGVLIFMLWIDRKRVLRPGRLFAVYLVAYGIGRFGLEMLRIDPVSEFFGMRAHAWAMVVQVLGAAGFLYWDWRQHREDPDDTTDDDSDGDAARDKNESESDDETDDSDESEVTASADSGD
jgi:prolipoprotein diacylglyceryl transferase